MNKAMSLGRSLSALRSGVFLGCLVAASLPMALCWGASLRYGSYLGGSKDDRITCIAVDTNGNIFVAGNTASWNFPTTNAYQCRSGNFVSNVPDIATLTNVFDDAEMAEVLRQVSRPNDGDAFVAKLDPTGSNILWSTYLGGNRDEMVFDLCVDQTGSVYVVGVTSSTNFPVMNAVQPRMAGIKNAFVAKLGAAGDLLFSSYLGGVGVDYGRSVAVDSTGCIYVGGTTTLSSTFPATNAPQANWGGGRSDAFIVKYDPSGTGLLFSAFIGGSRDDECSSIAVDGQGCVYLTGWTSSTNYPVVDAFMPTKTTKDADAFATKLSSNGSSIVWSTYLGGSDDDQGMAVRLDGSGGVFVVGETRSTNMPLTNALYGANAGGSDCFVAKFSVNGGPLIFSTYLGGSADDSTMACAIDIAGNLYVSGGTSSTNFPIVNSLQSSLSGSSDMFVSKISTTLALSWSSYLGGTDEDASIWVAVDNNARLYLAGETMSTNFPVTPGALQTTNSGATDGAVVIINL